MASPSMSFSPWRRRATSVTSQDRGISTPARGAMSPTRAKPQNIGDTRTLSSSVSTAHREPIRSFISGSARDSFGEYLDGFYMTLSRFHADGACEVVVYKPHVLFSFSYFSSARNPRGTTPHHTPPGLRCRGSPDRGILSHGVACRCITLSWNAVLLCLFVNSK